MARTLNSMALAVNAWFVSAPNWSADCVTGPLETLGHLNDVGTMMNVGQRNVTETRNESSEAKGVNNRLTVALALSIVAFRLTFSNLSSSG